MLGHQAIHFYILIAEELSNVRESANVEGLVANHARLFFVFDYPALIFLINWALTAWHLGYHLGQVTNGIAPLVIVRVLICYPGQSFVPPGALIDRLCDKADSLQLECLLDRIEVELL